MGAPKGHKRYGGRKKGTPNKASQQLKDKIAKKFPGWCPLVQLAMLANDPDAEIREQIHCCKEVAQYIYPKRKSIEHSGALDIKGIKITVDTLSGSGN